MHPIATLRVISSLGKTITGGNMRIKTALAIFCCFIFGACGMNQTITIKAPFDESQAKIMLLPGTNQIKGSGLIRQAGGGVVTCAGNNVILMPVTNCAREWAKHVFGSDIQGYYSTGMYRSITFSGADLFLNTVRLTNCDAAGFFNFTDVADGTFYVITRINWTVQNEIQGGSIMKSVTLSGGSKAEVTLSP
jgi:hypothetical protein